MKLENKVAIITGSAQGIGKSIAIELAKEGCNIVICDIDENLIKLTTEEISKLTDKQILSFKVDITKINEVEKMTKDIFDKLKKIDILINNAGITKDNLLIKMTDQEWDTVLEVNLKGVFNCTKSVSKIMIKQRSGRIVNIASVVGLMGNPGQANYSASKGGVIALTKTVAKELASRGILVNAIAPGFIKTRMTDKLSEEQKNKLIELIPLNRLGEPHDIARVVVFLCSDDSSYITGQTISVNGGMWM